MADIDRILIVGGGIAGLTLAAALHRLGYAAELIERSATWQTTGAGIAVQGNGMRTLNSIGVGSEVEAAGAALHHWGFYDQSGKALFEADLDKLWEKAGPFVGITRAKLQEALLRGAADVPVRLGVTVSSLSQDDHRVLIEFSDGSHSEYGLVVGADGISSSIRRLTLSKTSPVNSGHVAWRSLVPIRPQGLTSLQFILGDGCFFGLCPVGDGHTYGFGNVYAPNFHDEVKGRLERLRNRFADFGGPIPEYLTALKHDEQIHCSTIEWVQQEQWYKGRVVLIGDAAHASSPMMGQGGCLAMEDAAVLADVLQSADDVGHALDSYVKRRRPRVTWVQQESRAVAESFRLSPAVRNAALHERGKTMFERRFAPLVAPA